MPNLLENLLYESVARLTGRGTLGTGFFVAPGKLLTCAHVVRGAQADGSGLLVEYAEETLDVTSVLSLDSEYPDLALVTVTKTEHPCVELATDEEPTTGDALYTYGFPPDHRGGEAVTAIYEGRARPFQDSDQWLLKFREGRILGGHSGSPLLNRVTGAVCGVVKKSNTAALGFVAAGVPIQAVWKAFPELRKQQVEFHQRDERWTKAKMQATRILDDPLAQLARLPLDEIPAVAALPAGSRIPFTPNPLFSGRKQDLLAIAQMLAPATEDSEVRARGQVVLTGISGVGKTQLAVEFVHRYGQYFAGGVQWISFAVPAVIPVEIMKCGERMFEDPYNGKEASDPSAQAELRQKTRNEWEIGVPRLLVFDNADTEDAAALVDRWRPKTGEARILVTSQQTTWDPALSLRVWELGLLSRPESIALLRELRPGLNMDDADAVAKAVGDLPLALHLAGSYLQLYRGEIDVPQYLEELEGEGLDHESLTGTELGFRPTGHELNVYNSFRASYQRLNPEQAVDQLARSLLRRAACFRPGEAIPWELLVRATTVSNRIGNTHPTGKERRRLSSARRRLAGLVNVADDGDMTMHQLVAAFVQLSSDAQELDAARSDVEMAMVTLNNLASKNQLRYIAEKADQRNSETAGQLAQLLVQMGLTLDCTIQILDADGEFTQILLVGEAWTVRLTWEVPRVENRGLNGIWKTSIYMESLSSFNEFELDTEPILLPVDHSNDPAIYTVDVPVTPNLVPQGYYNIIGIVMNVSVDGRAGSAAGFGEDKILVRVERTPYFSPVTFSVPVKVAVFDEKEQSSDIFSSQEVIRIEVRWTTPELPAALSGNWKVALRLESIGPGIDYELPKDPYLVPAESGLEAASYTAVILVEPGTLAAGAGTAPYYLKVIVEHVGADEKPTNLVGYGEGSLVMVYTP